MVRPVVKPLGCVALVWALQPLSTAAQSPEPVVVLSADSVEMAEVFELRVEVPVPGGSVVYFPETLMHTAVPILSEKKRYVMFYAYVPPWFEVWHGGEVPKEIVESYDDMTLRKIIGGDDQWGYNGQSPVC